MYKLLRSILFLFPPEWTHYFSMNSLKFLCSIGLKGLIRSFFKPKNIPVSLFGIQFKNPVGLGAGFDKNAKYLNELECLGFGFIEIGTVTPKPQAGNEKPRLFRLPKDRALINRMGFNNDGVEIISSRLKNWMYKNQETSNHKLQTTNHKLIIGGNIGKNKSTPNEDAWKDYETCFTGLHPYVDYFVVNVSSPNTPGLRELQEKRALYKILTHLQEVNKNYTVQKPLLLKISPDLTQEQIEDVIDLALEIQLDGLVVCNTTISRNELQTTNHKLQTIGPGGLSGKPLEKRSTELVSFISKKTNGKIPIISSGGIFTGEDAQEKIAAGASLVQVWTGFIYIGPFIVKKICKYLGH
jgi:dihydroorotate dehydrogenase